MMQAHRVLRAIYASIQLIGEMCLTVTTLHNERAKLTASWLNALATALIAAGAFAPSAAWLYGLSMLPIGMFYLSALAFACVAAGAGLHVSALAMLGRLRE